MESYVQEINQLATALGKTEPDKVLKLKMSTPNQGVSFAPDTQNSIPGWAQNLETKLYDQMKK